MNKTELTLLAILAIATISLYNMNNHTQPQNKQFQLWKNKYAKQYSSIEHDYRMGIWIKNLAFVQEHNQKYQDGKESYDVQMNQFADLSLEEFRATYLIDLNKKVGDQANCTKEQAPDSSLPEAIDWEQKGAVTPVKNQGQCGSCWAFSTTGSLEGAHFIAKGSLVSFSEQQLVDCSKSYGNQGCNGGWMDSAFYYVKDHGITTEAKYPYKGVGQTCHYNEESDKAWTISKCSDVTANKEKALMAAIAKGPVSVAIQANQIGFQLYKTGVFNGLCGHKLDHGVLAVGYGQEGGKDFYKVKNSWGATWGLKGYILIHRGGDDAGKCGIQMNASFPWA